jgi:nucleolar protein 9
MPKDNRKRGKKHRKALEGAPEITRSPDDGIQQDSQAGPSWIAINTQKVDEAAPFGSVDADVKAYFRSVDIQIRDWQKHSVRDEDEDGDVDPNEGMCFSAGMKDGGSKHGQRDICSSWQP